MKMLKLLAAAAALATLPAGIASAATLSGVFDVKIVNATNLNWTTAAATEANYDTAMSTCFGGSSVCTTADFDITYEGDLAMRIGGGNSGSTDIWDFLTNAGGTVTGLEETDSFAGLQLSGPNLNNGTATTTFFMFTLKTTLDQHLEFDVTHDDGIEIYLDGVSIGGNPGPTGEVDTKVTGFTGGEFSILYVATNGNPSILEVDAAVVPVPASLPLLAAGLGGLGLLARRRRAKS